MREILFRGKHSDNEWYYGSLIFGINGKAYISSNGEAYPTQVYAETVGQYTGLTDKNGKKIFEGDIVKYENKIYEIKYLEKYARFAPSNEHSVFMVCAFNHLEVVGNVHDNPELLKDDNILSEKLKEFYEKKKAITERLRKDNEDFEK